jgi:hypothetical protein
VRVLARRLEHGARAVDDRGPITITVLETPNGRAASTTAVRVDRREFRSFGERTSVRQLGGGEPVAARASIRVIGAVENA